mmetsp:Transcript_18259/g.47697  ORF Transcript_18259/g.47697 Transcript_18259/m.47697 type:complete len:455 (-) Transcript_18259:84-1448(-)
MLRSIALAVLCAGRIFWEDWNPPPTGPSATGFCGGAAGWECTACEPSTSVEQLHDIEAEEKMVRARLDELQAQRSALLKEVSATASDFDLWFSAIDELPHVAFESGEPRESLPRSAAGGMPATSANGTAVQGEPRRPPPIKTLDDGRRILYNSEMVAGTPEEVPGCEDNNVNCTWWAEIGECINNPSYVMKHCPLACGSCRLKLPQWKRCHRRPDAIPLVTAPHGLNRLFESMVNNATLKALYNTTVLSTDPWILQFDNFATTHHWDQIERAVFNDFVESTVVGPDAKKGTIGRQIKGDRTSTNAWCGSKPCIDSEAHVDLQNRLADMLGTTPAYMEALQVLRYEEGQYYRSHHDVIDNHLWMMPGPRVLTAFMYFNEVAQGGETNFDQLGIKVSPKLGRMVLWPSVKDADSYVQDLRTHHEAVTVTKGFKRAANLWVHLHDWNTPQTLSCDMG